MEETQAPVYIFLIEEADMKTQASGIKTLLVYPSSENIAFKFENIPEGEYAVRIFQDSDGNKKLNRGLFGPTEPWALSWKEGVNTKKIPNFSDISFSLNTDLVLDFDLSNGRKKCVTFKSLKTYRYLTSASSSPNINIT